MIEGWESGTYLTPFFYVKESSEPSVSANKGIWTILVDTRQAPIRNVGQENIV